MNRIGTFVLVIALCILLFGCAQKPEQAEIVATTLPVYNFTKELCEGTGLNVTRLITEDVSCLHDYTLQVSQMQALENAKTLILSGAGLEDFLADISIEVPTVIDASSGISLIHCQSEHEHNHDHDDTDPHYWLSPECAMKMCSNICMTLSDSYPEHIPTFQENYANLEKQFDALMSYAKEELRDLSSRQIITFHDGFQYMADAFDLEIVCALEEESGREASAAELIELINLIEAYSLPAIFTEINGSTSAANIIAAEANIPVYSLDMAMSADDYFSAMYYNIDILKEALE